MFVARKGAIMILTTRYFAESPESEKGNGLFSRITPPPPQAKGPTKIVGIYLGFGFHCPRLPNSSGHSGALRLQLETQSLTQSAQDLASSIAVQLTKELKQQ